MIAEAALSVESIWGSIGAFALILSAFLTGLYQIEVLIRAFFPGEGEDVKRNEKVKEAGWRMKLSFVVLMALAVLISVLSGPMAQILSAAAGGTL
jgi:multicomponent Na+:H+ antiporter subunit D